MNETIKHFRTQVKLVIIVLIWEKRYLLQTR